MRHTRGKQIAESFIATQDMKGHTVKFVETRDLPKWPNELSVIFDLFSPAGNLVDGPIIVVVDKHSCKARFFESPRKGGQAIKKN